ncbi:MAG: plasmid pRiA4b ORF-3 family protein [Desulfomonile tiedjei]|uniref:Plasmid pRiA4b ORF-3 family protein n=1 Tax=Desulfomonile tiedjei TaxID=2358 RepID=A0A9D6V6J7_9BACT|nr:plasmid pRiA4b ORF-3 family protein [Desulfomonile tiedjei]
MPVKKKSDEKRAYQIKVTLRDIRPPIWRRMLVPCDIRLDNLHRVLQVVMGWTDSHLHEFIIDGVSYGDPSLDVDMGDDVENEKRFNLHKVVPGEKSKFHYLYDFGDSWEHEILVEKILPIEKGTRYPVCLAGKRACPPEDCGGAPGYENLLEALKDPSHPEHEEMFEWLPGDFDSEKFDIKSINVELGGSPR